MAHPLNRPKLDRAQPARHRGIRDPATAGHADIADRARRIAVPARVLRSRRHGSVRLRRLRCVPGSARRGFLHRQGDLRSSTSSRPPSQGGSRRTRCSVTTSWRGSSRAPDWSPISRSSRSFRRATTSPRRASIVGRAATGNCFPGSSAVGGTRARDSAQNDDSVRRPLEDDGQPAPNAGGAGHRCSPCWRVGLCRSRPPRCGARECSPWSRCPPSCLSSPGSCRDGSGSRSAATCARSAEDLESSHCCRSRSWSRSSPIRRG